MDFIEWKVIIVPVVAVLLLISSAIVYKIHSTTGTFLLLLALGLLFLLWAIEIHFDLWARMPSWLRHTIGAVVAFAIIVFLVVEGLILSGFSAQGEKNLDYIIVLGAQVYRNGPCNVLRFRLNKACDYLMENEDTLCIVSGGQGSNEPFSEAQGMYDYLIEKGINADRILIEDKSLNTVENLTNSSAYFDKEKASVGIVTSNFHIFRSVRLAKKLGLKNVRGIAADVVVIYLPGNMLREFFGVSKDFLYGNI
ncbi:MAG: YdcF family protein [Clostridiales bacterium]|nr:YdcF family protein [Clostridiales bacterium]